MTLEASAEESVRTEDSPDIATDRLARAHATPYGRVALWILLPCLVFYIGITRGHHVDTSNMAVDQTTQPLWSEEIWMKAGLDALYTRNDPDTAAAQFRQVLELNPMHYGAVYQLATALDRSGRPTEARPLWEKMLKMAEASNDQPTLQTVRQRLQKRP